LGWGGRLTEGYKFITLLIL